MPSVNAVGRRGNLISCKWEAYKLLSGASAKALCVLAHPCYYTSFAEIIETLVEELVKNYNISGIEVWHPSNPKESRDWLTKIANRYSLFCTGGSDAHNVEQIGAEGASEEVLEYLPCL